MHAAHRGVGATLFAKAAARGSGLQAYIHIKVLVQFCRVQYDLQTLSSMSEFAVGDLNQILGGHVSVVRRVRSPRKRAPLEGER